MPRSVSSPRRDMWFSIEIMTDDASMIRSVWQDDLNRSEVGQVNEDNGEVVARQRLAEWSTDPLWVAPKQKFDWYRVTITDQFSGNVVYCMTTKRLE